MTNAEKYLKDGTNINELAREMLHEYYEDTGITIPLLVCTFFDKETKPILTDDERVILRNIRGYDIIKRKDNVLYLQQFTDIYVAVYLRGYDHLFQFIKERRRILY